MSQSCEFESRSSQFSFLLLAREIYAHAIKYNRSRGCPFTRKAAPLEVFCLRVGTSAFTRIISSQKESDSTSNAPSKNWNEHARCREPMSPRARASPDSSDDALQAVGADFYEPLARSLA